jgi:hypothetical protein
VNDFFFFGFLEIELKNNEDGSKETITSKKRKFLDNDLDALVLDDQSWLQETQRTACSKCSKNRKFFCYDCLISIAPSKTPILILPVQLDM